MVRLKDSIYAMLCVWVAGIVLFLFNNLRWINYEVLFSVEALLFVLYLVSIYLVNALLIANKNKLPAISRELLARIYVIEIFFTLIIVFISQSLVLSYCAIALTTLTFSLIATYQFWCKDGTALEKEKDKSFLDKTLIKGYLSIYTILVITILAIFICIRFYLIKTFSGSYLDEYLHIFTGLSFFDNSYHQVYNLAPYDRGIYVSLISGVISKIFGNQIELQKLIPLCIGCINFLFLNNISKIFLKKSWLRLVLLLTYSCAPLIIFNDIYIRTYVFYELFAYISISLAYSLIVNYEHKKWKEFLYTLVFIAVYVLLLILSKEIEVLLFIMLLFLILGLYFLASSNQILHLPGIEKFKVKNIYIILLAIVAAVILSRFININKYIDTFFYGQLDYGGGSAEKYLNLFYIELIFISALFINTGFILFIGKYSKISKVFIFSVFLLFILHQVITPDFRNLRGIFYFIPLFFLGGLVIFETLNIKSMIFNLIFSVLFITTPLISIQQYLNIGPTIPKEIDYFPFNEYYSVVKSECGNSQIVSAMHSNFISNFYNVKPNFILYLRTDLLEEDVRYYKDAGKYYQNEDSVPVITDFQTIQDLINNNRVCVLVSTEFRHTGGYVSASEYSELFNGMKTVEVKSLKILKNF